MSWHFTKMLDESYRGLEFLCDFCNSLYDGEGDWFYGRYEKSLQPYGFYCPQCTMGLIE